MFGYTFKVIKINTITKEVETILENEEFVMIAKDVANRANNTKKENEEIKLFNFKDEEIEYKTNNRTNERNYKYNTKLMRNNYIKVYWNARALPWLTSKQGSCRIERGFRNHFEILYHNDTANVKQKIKKFCTKNQFTKSNNLCNILLDN